jgi:hypothetical protein
MSRRFSAAWLVAGTLAAATAQAEVCSHTLWSTAFNTGCAGSFAGGLSGGSSELAALGASFGGAWDYVGSSADAGFGPFTGNPQVAFNGVLNFDDPVSGRFVLGIVSNGQHSFYAFSTKRRIGGLGFDSLEGVATTPQGNPFPLDYAVLYVASQATLLGWRRRQGR